MSKSSLSTGWVEHNPREIWLRVQEVIHGALSAVDIDPREIASIGITNQRETTLIWGESHRTAGLQRHCLARYPHRSALQ